MSSPDSTAAEPMESAFSELMDAIIELIRSGNRPEILTAQRLLLERLATQGDVFPGRIPPPRNITEIGGYLNLLERAGEPSMRSAAIASALGIAGPSPHPAFVIDELPVGFSSIGNDRPEGTIRSAIPPLITIRADFAVSLATARDKIHAFGCQLPLRSRIPLLSDVTLDGSGVPTPPEILAVLGRRLEIFPGCILVDPAEDALALARPAAPSGENVQLVARALASSATVPEEPWVALQATTDAVAENPTEDRRYLRLADILDDAGWIHPQPTALPQSLAIRGTLVELQNLTGLIANETRLGDELNLLYPPATISRSALANHTNRIWNGEAFVNPT